MTDAATSISPYSREVILHALYEAAELEHNLMCTYLYAAFSLKAGVEEGLSTEEAAATARWRRAILDVAIDEMGHLAAVWNITAALGGAPRCGRTNFPIDPGYLPAGVVVKLAPFNEHVLQHFIHLERPHKSLEPDGEGFAPERNFVRGSARPRLTPMGMDYETVGDFYAMLGENLRAFTNRLGEKAAFCGDPALQLSPTEIDLGQVRPVKCLQTALEAFNAIVTQGEGAPEDSEHSHFQAFIRIRGEYAALKSANPDFAPAFPAAHNPVLRRPPKPEGHVWIENEEAAETVDVANAAYTLMLRAIAFAFTLRSPSPDKALVVDLAIGLMKAVAILGERAARLPAGPSHPNCTAGISFVALRDAAALSDGSGARHFLVERFTEIEAGAALLGEDQRVAAARDILRGLSERAKALLP
jgi:hypothetical protein